MFRSFTAFTSLAIITTAVACSSPESPAAASGESAIEQGSPPDVAATPLAKETHWFRNSAEYRALTRQAYAMATRALDANAAAYKGGGWGVVLDVDETVLDNSQQQKENQGKPFSPDAWTAWVKRKEAKAVPGAIAFTRHVHERGGKVVLVTNRMNGTECPATEENLKAVGVPYDAILCKVDTSDKNPRFKAVASGTAVPALGALQILAFVGDNIQDFPDQTQELAGKDDAAYAEFGTRFFVMPNPMYGSWEKNPQN